MADCKILNKGDAVVLEVPLYEPKEMKELKSKQTVFTSGFVCHKPFAQALFVQQCTGFLADSAAQWLNALQKTNKEACKHPQKALEDYLTSVVTVKEEAATLPFPLDTDE